MEVIAMIVVVAGAEHGREILAAVGPDVAQEAARAEGEQAGLLDVDVTAAAEFDAADIERIAFRVLGH